MPNESRLNNICTLMLYYVYEYVLSGNVLYFSVFMSFANAYK